MEIWCRKWRISLNSEKTQAVCFTKCTMKRVPKLKICGKFIEFQKQVKYLGVILDRRLTWHPHIQSAKGKAIGRIIHLFPILKSGALNIKRKLHLFRALILPILTYAAPAWAYAKPSTLKPLQVAQNKALRLIHASDWYTTTVQIHEDLEMPYLSETLKRNIIKFYSNLPSSQNAIVKNLGNFNGKDFSSYRTPKLALSDMD